MKIKLFIVLLSLIQLTVKAQQLDDLESQIDSILAQMTLEEKVAMCHAQSKFSSAGVPRLGVPEIWMSDGPHGVRAEVSFDSWAYAGWSNDSITAFPALTALAATFNEDLAMDYGVALGEEARYRKKDIILGPGVNIYRTPLNGRNFEYMGEDPYLSSKMVVPYIQGVQTNGVAACVKHFALNNQEVWRGHINVNISERALREIYLPAFKAAVVEGNAWSMMGAYNQLRGQHCCHNYYLLQEILKQEWGYDGVVVSDWSGAHNTEEAAANGLDIEMGSLPNGPSSTQPFEYAQYYLANPYLEGLKSGIYSEDQLNDKVRRNLRLILRTSMNPDRPFGRINNKEHHDVALNVAQEGIVLLKNEDNFFPIKDEPNQKVLIVGENAIRSMTIGGGSSELKVLFEVSPLDGIKELYENTELTYTMGYASGPPTYERVAPSPYDADSLRAKAVEMAAGVDKIIFIGGLNKNHQQDSEAGDRLAYDLPFGQEALLNELYAVNPNIGVVLISGNAVEMNWDPKVKGIMQGWYLGSMSGYAIANVVAGKVNPSGKLPFSFPKNLNDNGAHSFGELSYPGDSINQFYKEDILVGYRWHDTKKIPSMYAFGHGKSYTTYSVQNITLESLSLNENDRILVQFEVTNTGEMDGAEVVQVYIGKTKSKVSRAEKELKGFKKVFVNKGEVGSAVIEIPVSSLAYYNEEKSAWEIEKGKYKIHVGNASDAIVWTKTISIN